MYELKNQMESIVREVFLEYLKDHTLNCMCGRCQADIMAYVLNRLPARYTVSQRGEILTYLENRTSPNKVKIMAEIVNAVEKIESSPSHWQI